MGGNGRAHAQREAHLRDFADLPLLNRLLPVMHDVKPLGVKPQFVWQGRPFVAEVLGEERCRPRGRGHRSLLWGGEGNVRTPEKMTIHVIVIHGASAGAHLIAHEHIGRG